MARHVLEQLHRRRVGLVQVIEDQHGARRCGDGVQQGNYRLEHPVSVGASRGFGVPGPGRTLGGRQAGQQLGQVGRGRAGDQLEPVGAQPGGMRAKGLHEREKRHQGLPDRPPEKDLPAFGSGGRRHLGGQPGLADAGVAFHHDQLALAASGPAPRRVQDQPRTLAAHEREPATARRAGSGFRWHVVDGRVLLQDGRFQAAQARPRDQAQLLGQHPVGILVGGQGIALPAGPVHGEHELFPEPLVQRVSHHQALKLTGKRGVAAEREIGVDSPLNRSHLHRLKPGHLGLGEGIIPALAQHRAAHQHHGVAQSRRRAGETLVLQVGLGHR